VSLSKTSKAGAISKQLAVRSRLSGFDVIATASEFTRDSSRNLVQPEFELIDFFGVGTIWQKVSWVAVIPRHVASISMLLGRLERSSVAMQSRRNPRQALRGQTQCFQRTAL
jgi:hypothetical protein